MNYSRPKGKVVTPGFFFSWSMSKSLILKSNNVVQKNSGDFSVTVSVKILRYWQKMYSVSVGNKS